MRRAFAVLIILLVAGSSAAQPARPHNVILFVPDGLRAAIVDENVAPAMAAIRHAGVDFANSHSIFPTFTTANASAFATGHYPGDTGDFSNVIYAGFRVAASAATETPFLENDAVLDEMDSHYHGNYLNEEALLTSAHMAGFSTAAIGKLGPVAIQDLAHGTTGTIVIDDDTGNGGIPLSAEIKAALKKAGIADAAPARADTTANVDQQKYFVDVATKFVLPRFKAAAKPFFFVFWSRDPDGTQHNQTDSIGKLTPGINGPSSLAAIRNADNNLASLQASLKNLGLADSTDIIVAADHGFSTVSKESKTSSTISMHFDDTFASVAPGTLPPGFIAIDLAKALGMPLFDPDRFRAPVDFEHGVLPKKGNGLLGSDKDAPDIVIASNGGSDLIYLPRPSAKTLSPKIVAALLKEDYVSGLFVDDTLGSIPGALPMSAINLKGTAVTPTPSLLVNFRSFATGCENPLRCTAEVADAGQQQGQGMHGSFSRADTANFMAAIGPDFKRGYRDAAPVSNADIAMTIAQLLGLKRAPKGKLTGRVIAEGLTGGPASVRSETMIMRSAPAGTLTTLLRYQSVGDVRYFDAAGFAGRTVGLE